MVLKRRVEIYTDGHALVKISRSEIHQDLNVEESTVN
jgi:hypothetical protein